MPKRGKPISCVENEAHPLLGQISPFKGTELKLDSNKSDDSIDPLSSTLIRIFKTIEFLHTMHAQAKFLVHNYGE